MVLKPLKPITCVWDKIRCLYEELDQGSIVDTDLVIAVESLLKLYPEADIYTLFYDKDKYGDHLKNHNVYTSKLNTSFFRKHYQKIFPLYPFAVKSLKLKQDYDLIISSDSFLASC